MDPLKSVAKLTLISLGSGFKTLSIEYAINLVCLDFLLTMRVPKRFQHFGSVTLRICTEKRLKEMKSKIIINFTCLK